MNPEDQIVPTPAGENEVPVTPVQEETAAPAAAPVEEAPQA